VRLEGLGEVENTMSLSRMKPRPFVLWQSASTNCVTARPPFQSKHFPSLINCLFVDSEALKCSPHKQEKLYFKYYYQYSVYQNQMQINLVKHEECSRIMTTSDEVKAPTFG
jgi:hypothetical protein